MSQLLNRLNLNSVYHFYVVANMRSLKHAAQALNLSAPAVTHSLNNLESAVGESLCIRNRSEFSLTPTGQQLFRTAQNIFNEIGQFASRNDSEENYSGILSIGILDHFEEEYLLESIQNVVKKFPKLKLSIQAFDSEMLNSLLLEREIDVAFGIFSHKSPRIKYIKVGNEKMKYFISNKHPLWIKKKVLKEDLFGQKVAWIDNQSRKKVDLEANIFVNNPKYKMQFYGFSNNLSGALGILLSGHAVVPLPEHYGEQLSRRYEVKKLELENKGTELVQYLAYNPATPQSAALKSLLTEIDAKKII